MIVRLTLLDMQAAALTAVHRRYWSRQQGVTRSETKPFNGGYRWDGEIEGAAAECAYAKAHNLAWAMGVNTFLLPDVGDVHVRSTRHPHGCLIIRPRDPDGTYALVVGGDGEYRVAGRLQVTKADLPPAYLRSDPNYGEDAWFIPQSALQPDQ